MTNETNCGSCDVPLFLTFYASAIATAPADSALTVDELGERLELTCEQRVSLRNDCERHGRHWIDADRFVTVWNRGL